MEFLNEDGSMYSIDQTNEDMASPIQNERLNYASFLRQVLLRLDLLTQCYKLKMKSLGHILNDDDFFSKEASSLVDLIAEEERRYRSEAVEDLDDDPMAPLQVKSEIEQITENEDNFPQMEVISYHEDSSTDIESDSETKPDVNSKDPDWSLEMENTNLKKRNRKKNQNQLASVRSVSKKNPGVIQCGFCDSVFESAHALNDHLFAEHSNKMDSSNRPNVSDGQSLDTGFQSFKCPRCKGLFASEKFLQIHLETHHSGSSRQPVDAGQKLSSESLRPPQQPVAGSSLLKNVFRCEGWTNCRARFESQEKLDIHIDRHRQRKEELGKRCRRCDISFPNRFAHYLHYEKYHREPRDKIPKVDPSLCTKCGKCFACKSDLQSHEITHLPYEQRPFECETCHKRFGQRSTLNVHIRTHTRELTHLCALCGSAFTSASHLYAHRLCHFEKRYSCSYCQRKFRRQGELTVHIRRHVDERRYKCDVCDKRFFSLAEMKKHKQTHLEVKRHACPYCTLTCSQFCNLRSHVRRRHGIILESKRANTYEVFSDDKFKDYQPRKRRMIDYAANDAGQSVTGDNSLGTGQKAEIPAPPTDGSAVTGAP